MSYLGARLEACLQRFRSLASRWRICSLKWRPSGIPRRTAIACRATSSPSQAGRSGGRVQRHLTTNGKRRLLLGQVVEGAPSVLRSTRCPRLPTTSQIMVHLKQWPNGMTLQTVTFDHKTSRCIRTRVSGGSVMSEEIISGWRWLEAAPGVADALSVGVSEVRQPTTSETMAPRKSSPSGTQRGTLH